LGTSPKDIKAELLIKAFLSDNNFLYALIKYLIINVLIAENRLVIKIARKKHRV